MLPQTYYINLYIHCAQLASFTQNQKSLCWQNRSPFSVVLVLTGCSLGADRVETIESIESFQHF